MSAANRTNGKRPAPRDIRATRRGVRLASRGWQPGAAAFAEAIRARVGGRLSSRRTALRLVLRQLPGEQPGAPPSQHIHLRLALNVALNVPSRAALASTARNGRVEPATPAGTVHLAAPVPQPRLVLVHMQPAWQQIASRIAAREEPRPAAAGLRVEREVTRVREEIMRRLVERGERVPSLAVPGARQQSAAPELARPAVEVTPSARPVPMTVQRPAPASAAPPQPAPVSTPDAPGAPHRPPTPFPQAEAPPPIDIDRLTDQVVRAIDRRIIAHRERMGRV